MSLTDASHTYSIQAAGQSGVSSWLDCDYSGVHLEASLGLWKGDLMGSWFLCWWNT